MAEASNAGKVRTRPPRGAPPLKIELHSANLQPSSPLFDKLSAELRYLIYSFVFRPRTVHVLLRACNVNDNWTRVHISQQESWPLSDDNGFLEELDMCETRTFMKTSSYACLFECDWERQYALSKHPEAIPRHYLDENGRPSLFGRPCPEAVSPPFKLHGLCPDIGEFKCGNIRLELSLLQTCRRIYLETWSLPFANFTFEFMPPHPGVVQDFVTAMLYEHQARAIERVHVHNLRKWSDYGAPEGVFQHLPALKHLRVSCEHGDGLEGTKEDWEKVCKPASLRTVQVVVCHDYDPQQVTRFVRRKRAVAAERVLLGEQLWQRRQLFDAEREEGDCFQLESNVLIAPNDRAEFWTV